MSKPDTTAARRYVAFISYSHVDRDVARWLHRSIESYRLPAHIHAAVSVSGKDDSRLAPIFLDREDLPSSTDLAESVRLALLESDALIVVCSPAAARSRWVNEEVRLFKELGRESRIICLVVAGEPRAEDKGLSPDLECLPPALRFAVIDGVVTTQVAPEPLAADLRPGGDTRRDAKLKIIAGLLGTGLDELRRRDLMRRHRQLAAVVAAAAIGCVAFAGLALSALLQRNEAERQRRLAEQKSLTAERTADFMISLFQVSDPSEARGNAVTAREILDRGARQIDQSLREEPQVRADLSVTLGEVYTGLGLYNSAYGLLEQGGRHSRRRRRTPDCARPLRWPNSNSNAATTRGLRNCWPPREVLARDRRNGATPALRARILLDRGDVAAYMERDAIAQEYFRQALRIGNENRLGEVTPRALEGIALATFYGGDMGLARRSYEDALAVRIRHSGETHPKVSESLTALGSIAYTQGKPDEAEQYWLRSLAVDQRILGSRHPDVAVTLNNLGRLDLERRNFVRAGERLAHAVSIYAAEQSEAHEGRVFAWTNLALANIGLGRFDVAESLLQRALSVAIATKHRLESPILTDLADLECRTQRVDTGLARLESARPLLAERYPDEPWRAALVDNVRAGCLAQIGREAEAEPLIVSSLPVLIEKWSPDTYYGHDAVQRATRVYTLTGNRTRLTELAMR